MTCQDIAHIHVILHCNNFIILSKGTDCEITTRDQGYSSVVTAARGPGCPGAEALVLVPPIPKPQALFLKPTH